MSPEQIAEIERLASLLATARCRRALYRVGQAPEIRAEAEADMRVDAANFALTAYLQGLIAPPPASIGERARFEAWAANELKPLGMRHPFMARHSKTNQYSRTWTSSRWESWQARAALGASTPPATQRDVSRLASACSAACSRYADLSWKRANDSATNSRAQDNDAMNAVIDAGLAFDAALLALTIAAAATPPAESADARDAALWRSLMTLPAASRRIWNHVLDESSKVGHDSIEAALTAAMSPAGKERSK
jgi:hypothetical protein